MSETPSEAAAPQPTPEEQAALDAHTQTNEEEQTWAGKVEARLTALEEHAGIGQEKADTAETKEEQS